MFGCLVRSAVLAVVLGASAWWWRDAWAPHVPVVGEWIAPAKRAASAVAEAGRAVAGATTPDAAPEVWVRVADSTAGAARRAARTLGRTGGPAFVAVDGAAAAALALGDLRTRLPSGLTDVAVQVTGEEITWRAVVRPAEFGGQTLLGPVYRLLPERDTVRVRGTLEGVRAGLGQFRVRSVRFGSVPVPTRAIAPLLRQVAGGSARPAGVADDAFAVPLPKTVGDVRVRDGRVTLYRAEP